jgi:hypothetical protein
MIFSYSPLSLSNQNIVIGQPINSPTFSTLTNPLKSILPAISPLESESNRPMTFSFDYQLKSLIYYHTEEHTSALSLLEEMQEGDSFAKNLPG